MRVIRASSASHLEAGLGLASALSAAATPLRWSRLSRLTHAPAGAQGLGRMQGDASFPHPLWMDVAQGCGQVCAGPGLQRCQDGWRKNDQPVARGFRPSRSLRSRQDRQSGRRWRRCDGQAGIERCPTCGEPGDHVGCSNPLGHACHSRAAIDQPCCLGNRGAVTSMPAFTRTKSHPPRHKKARHRQQPRQHEHAQVGGARGRCQQRSEQCAR